MKIPNSEHINFFRSEWGLSGEVKFHRTVTNHIYFSELNGHPVVLRITESFHRNPKQIQSEIDWLRHLAQSGLTVVQPMRTNNGSFVVQTPGGEFLATLFSKAPGKPLEVQKLNHDFIEKWGGYLGEIHKLTLNYQDPSGKQSREQWFEESSLKLALQSVDKGDPLLRHRFHEIIEWLRSLPKAFDCFGLVHSDLHEGNFFVDDNTIWSFDYDDSCYHWFAYDLIPALNSIYYMNEENNLGFERNQIKESFLRGYLKEHHLDKIWLERLPLFERFRAALMYFWLQTKLDHGVFDEKAIDWCRKRMPLIREQFESPPPSDPKFNRRPYKLHVNSGTQTAILSKEDQFFKQYKISTAKAGLSCADGSFGTPTGKLRVACKIGHGYPMGSIFKARVPTGECYTMGNVQNDISNQDLVLSRILWLEGTEEENSTTLTRNIYLHGTNQENLLGSPASHGCIRFSNADIIDLFELLEVGCEVEVC